MPQILDPKCLSIDHADINIDAIQIIKLIIDSRQLIKFPALRWLITIARHELYFENK